MRTGRARSPFSLTQRIWWRVGARVVQVARKVVGSGSERAHPSARILARRCLPVRGVGASMVGCAGGLRVCVLWWRVGGPGRAQSCWKWIRARASLLASSAHVCASAGSWGKHGWVRGKLVDWTGRGRCPFSLAQRIMVVRGCAGGLGRGQSCWKWIRALACWLASSAHVCQCGESGQAWLGAQEAANWSCCSPFSLAQCILWWRVGAWVAQVARKVLEVDPSARVRLLARSAHVFASAGSRG